MFSDSQFMIMNVFKTCNSLNVSQIRRKPNPTISIPHPVKNFVWHDVISYWQFVFLPSLRLKYDRLNENSHCVMLLQKGFHAEICSGINQF